MLARCQIHKRKHNAYHLLAKKLYYFCLFLEEDRIKFLFLPFLLLHLDIICGMIRHRCRLKPEFYLSSFYVKSQHSYFSQPYLANINSEIHNMLILCYPFIYYFHKFWYHDWYHDKHLIIQAELCDKSIRSPGYFH